MSDLRKIDINNVCRTCLLSSEQMTSLFEAYSSATGICFAQILTTFAPIECDYNDGLPNQICLNCADQLNQFDAFRSKCVASNTTLGRVINKNTYNAIFFTNDAQINSDTQTEPQTDPLATISNADDIKEEEIKLELNENPPTSANQAEHQSAKPYSCPPKHAVVRKALNNHDAKPYASSSAGKKRYSCDKTSAKLVSCGVCGKVFNRNFRLLTNKRLHTARNTFVCTLCKASKAAHASKHTTEKPYACKVCGKTYSRKANLAAHRRLHAGAKTFAWTKPFACTLCECAYSRKDRLKAHACKHQEETVCVQNLP